MSSIKIIFLPDSQHPPANRKFQPQDQYCCFRPAAGFDWLPQSHAQKKQIVPAYPIHVLLLLSFFIRPSVNIDRLSVLNPQQKIFLSFRNQIAAQTALPSLPKLPATAIFPFPVLFSIILAFLFPLLSFPQTYPHHHFSSLFPSRPHFPSLSPNLSTTRPIPFPLVLPLTLIPNPGYFYFFSFASFLFFSFCFSDDYWKKRKNPYVGFDWKNPTFRSLSALSVSHRRRQSLDLAATDIRRPEFPFWLTCTRAAGRP